MLMHVSVMFVLDIRLSIQFTHTQTHTNFYQLAPGLGYITGKVRVQSISQALVEN
jgi:hypothetical protein